MNSTLLKPLNELDKQFFIKSMSIWQVSTSYSDVGKGTASAEHNKREDKHQHNKDKLRNKEEE